MRYVIENEPKGTSTRTYNRECWVLKQYYKGWSGEERMNIIGWSYIEERLHELIKINQLTLS